jgi:nucleotide-binding universal stress UspA family protein
MTTTNARTEDLPVAMAPTVVVPIDGSIEAERALPIARSLAQRAGGKVTIFSVDEDGDRGGDFDAYLEVLARDEAGVPEEVARVVDHSPARAIAELISAGPDRIVCMSTHGRGSLRWAILGSVAERVVRTGRRPVFLVGRHCNAEWPGNAEHMVVAIDGSTVADPVIPAAVQWAKALHLDVHVTMVAHPLDVDAATSSDLTLNAVVEQFIALGVHAIPVFLRGSHIAGAIADYAESRSAALIALNTHARAGAARFALGSVAIATVGMASCPVLVVPYPG